MVAATITASSFPLRVNGIAINAVQDTVANRRCLGYAWRDPVELVMPARPTSTTRTEREEGEQPCAVLLQPEDDRLSADVETEYVTPIRDMGRVQLG